MPNFLEILFETLVKKINSGIIIVPLIVMFIESLILNNQLSAIYYLIKFNII